MVLHADPECLQSMPLLQVIAYMQQSYCNADHRVNLQALTFQCMPAAAAPLPACGTWTAVHLWVEIWRSQQVRFRRLLPHAGVTASASCSPKMHTETTVCELSRAACHVSCRVLCADTHCTRVFCLWLAAALSFLLCLCMPLCCCLSCATILNVH